MKLILRKNDSATSILLFIYNNFLGLKKKDTIKLVSLLEIMKAFGKNETSIRMSLSRATKLKILVNTRKNNEVSYSLTDMGKEALKTWNEGVMYFWNRYPLRNKKWNGKWYFLIIDLKEDARDLKPQVIDMLQQLGFAPINTNTWISAYDQQDEIAALMKEFGLERHVMEVYGDLKIHEEMDIFLNKVFDINKLEASYLDFVNKFRPKLIDFKIRSGNGHLSNPETALPLLHELGWSFFNIAVEDPVLPGDLLSTWSGDAAANTMRELREILLKNVDRYFENFG